MLGGTRTLMHREVVLYAQLLTIGASWISLTKNNHHAHTIASTIDGSIVFAANSFEPDYISMRIHNLYVYQGEDITLLSIVGNLSSIRMEITTAIAKSFSSSSSARYTSTLLLDAWRARRTRTNLENIQLCYKDVPSMLFSSFLVSDRIVEILLWQ